MERVYNFSPGSSILPLPVLEQAQRELVSYGNTGTSVMEMSHRTPAYEAIIKGAEKSLRDIMGISDDYAVLFLQGGASLQFAMVPMNLLPAGGVADYADTGFFAAKAMAEAKKFGSANAVVSSKADNYAYVPEMTQSMLTPGAAYLHITTNNTIFGTHYPKLPSIGDVPLVADMSSNILGEEYDVNQFGLVYAGAQKNMGPAGLTVVIVRKDLLGKAGANVPVMMDYKVMAENESMYNTPPCWSIYVAGLVFEWVKTMGGVKSLEAINKEKAGLVYDVLGNSKMFKGTARPDCRSIMNVTFTLPDEESTGAFVKLCASHGLVNLKGHRAVGGIRASMYNAMPLEGAKALVNLMKEFEAKGGK